MSQMCGGLGKANEVDQEITDMCVELKGEVEKHTGKAFNEYKPISYRSQVVAGTNFFVKIAVDESGEEHIHVRIFKPLPHTNGKPSVSACQTGKKHDDAIEFF